MFKDLRDLSRRYRDSLKQRLTRLKERVTFENTAAKNSHECLLLPRQLLDIPEDPDEDDYIPPLWGHLDDAMSKVLAIHSPSELQALVKTAAIVIVDCYSNQCAPCKAIAPLYKELAEQFTINGKMVFTKVDTSEQREIATNFKVDVTPTFLIFQFGMLKSRIKSADPDKLSETVRQLSAEAASPSFETWLGESIAPKCQDVTDKIDLKNIEILNSDSGFGNHSTLFQNLKPSGLDAKGKGKATGSEIDWVESDTDEQLMIYMPFNSMLNIQAVHLTSVVDIFPSDEEKEEYDASVPMLPKTLHFYINLTYALGFDEAENLQPTQSVTLKPLDWNPKTRTANIPLRFVKFQNVGSLVIFVVDGEGGRERVRLDRIRIIGETREQRNPGKLEKIGDDH